MVAYLSQISYQARLTAKQLLLDDVWWRKVVELRKALPLFNVCAQTLDDLGQTMLPRAGATLV